MHQLIMAMVQLRPMAIIAILFISGILVGVLVGPGLLKLWILILSLIVGLYLHRPARHPSLFVLGVICCGIIRISINQTHSPNSLKYFIPETDKVYSISGIILDRDEVEQGKHKYVLRVKSIDLTQIDRGDIILYWRGDSLLFKARDAIQLDANLQKPGRKRNPYSFDYGKYLENQGIYLMAYPVNQSVVIRESEANISLRSSIAGLRENALQHIKNHLSAESAGVLAALTLGIRSEIDKKISVDFANTGVIHVLAVSGLHVGYVSLILFAVVGMLRVSRLFQTIIVIIGLGFYVLLTGGAPSVMRASLMASLVLISSLVERKTEIYNTLGTAAIVILMIDPTQIFSLGFQLSFAAVLSIVSLYPIMNSKIKVHLDKMDLMLGKMVSAVSDLFLISLAAQLGTLPLTMLYFNKIPIISLIANLIVVPAVGLIVATGLAFLTLGSWIHNVGTYWAALLEALIQTMLSFVVYCGSLSWSFVQIRTINIAEFLLLFSAVGILLMKSWIVKLRVMLYLLLIWLNTLLWQSVFRNDVLEIVMLDVGQGDALVIHSPQGKTVVVDAGRKYGGRDMGQDVISPYLIKKGIDDIDMLVLTHPRNDHIGGAQYLLEHHHVKQVIMPAVEYESFTYSGLKNRVDSLNIPVRQMFTGHIDSSLKPIYIRVTGPKKYAGKTQPANVNDLSTVMQLFYGHTTLLLTGDAEKHVESDQLPFGRLLRSDLIKAPHHGSNTSSTTDYLELVMPEVALISCGVRNHYNHPHPETLQSYSNLGTEIYRTDIGGAIIFHSNGAAWKFYDWH